MYFILASVIGFFIGYFVHCYITASAAKDHGIIVFDGEDMYIDFSSDEEFEKLRKMRYALFEIRDAEKTSSKME